MKISINGKDYGLNWGLGAIEILCDRLECDITDLDDHILSGNAIKRSKALNNLTLAAMQNWCELNDIEFDVNYRQFQDWLTNQPQEKGVEIVNDWKKSKYFGSTVAEYFFGEVPATQTKTVKKNSRSAKS